MSLRVLQTVPSLHSSTGGPARSVAGLAKALGDAGAESFVWTADSEPCQASLGRAERLTGSIDHALSLGFDLVHDHGIWSPIHWRIARSAQRHQIPRVVSPRGMLEPWALKFHRWRKEAAWRLYQKQALSSALALHATAEQERQSILTALGPTTVILSPNGVDLPPGPNPRPRKARTHEHLALFLGRVHPKKGLPMLIRAWAEVRPANWRFRVVGPSELGHRQELMALASELKIDDCWEFLSEAQDSSKWSLLDEADVLILPTYSENFGIVVAEALAAGTPVLTTTGTPWSGLVSHDAGWYCAPTQEALQSSLLEVTQSTDARRIQMGANGQDWVRREFHWKGIGLRMLRQYRSLIQE